MKHQSSIKQHLQIYLDCLKRFEMKFPATPVIQQISLTKYLAVLML